MASFISVVIPVFNEDKNISELLQQDKESFCRREGL
jgi:glycosyltransferase involved in cell wall biosynthesis